MKQILIVYYCNKQDEGHQQNEFLLVFIKQETDMIVSYSERMILNYPCNTVHRLSN